MLTSNLYENVCHIHIYPPNRCLEGVSGCYSSTDLNSEICHPGQQVLEQLSVCGGQLGGKHHAHIVAWSLRHHVRKHEHPCVTQQHRRLRGHEGEQPVTDLPASEITCDYK